MFYTSVDFFKDRYDRFGRQNAMDVSSPEAFLRWQTEARTQLHSLLGLERCCMADSPAQLLEETPMEGYTRRKLLLETQPKLLMPFYLLVPDKPNGAAMLNPHGHGSGKEGSVGTEQWRARMRAEGYEPKGEAFAEKLARAGYYVACPDAIGAGERREAKQQIDGDEGSNSHRELLHMSVCFGLNPIGLMVWDLMRLMDYVCALDDVDELRVGCVGMSGGGQQTLYFAAADTRCAAAITSGYFYGFRDALMLLPSNCSCNYLPGMYERFDMSDLAAMIAPRPFFAESGLKDNLSGAPGVAGNVVPLVDEVRAAYGLLGCGERVRHSIHEGGHMFVGTGMMEFLEEYLGK